MSAAWIEQKEREYADRSGLTVRRLHAAGRIGALCQCGDVGCEGFQMMHARELLIEAGWQPPESRTSSAALVAQVGAAEAGRLTSWSENRQAEFGEAIADALVAAGLISDDR